MATNTSTLTPIMGKPVLTASRMNAYLSSINPSAPMIADLFLAEGLKEGVRGDLAFCQSLIETGNFKFKGSAVTLSQNNFGGLGVTRLGSKGNNFPTQQIGVRAQIQHLKAYATAEPLNTACVDTRYKYVAKGCAPYVEWLGIQENPENKGWAAGANYGQKILNVYKAIQSFKVTSIPSNVAAVNNTRVLLIKQTQNWINSFVETELVNSGINKLKVDGVAGPKTYAGLNIALKKYINMAFGARLSLDNQNITTATKSYFRKMVVKEGIEEPFVMILKMYFLFDGITPNDLSAVCDKDFANKIGKFQTKSKLKHDKIAGYNTWIKTVTS